MMIIVTILVLILSYRFYITLDGKIRVFSITSFFLLNYVFYNLIGSILLNYIKWYAEDSAGFYEHPDIVFRVWLYTILGFVGLFVGFVLSHLLFNYNGKVKQELIAGMNKPIVYSIYDSSRSSFNYVLILLAVAIFGMLLYRMQLGSLPIESILSGLNAKELALERSDATNNFSGKVYRYEIAFLAIPTFLMILTFFITRRTKEKSWKRLFYAVLIFLGFASVITLQKGPLISMFILLFLVYVFDKRQINKKLILTLALISVPVILIMYIFFMGKVDVPLKDIADIALHRILVGSISPFYWYIKYFDVHDFLYGASFPNPGGILPFNHVRLTVLMMENAYERGDVVGSMPTVFLGEMYANFGEIGMYLSSIVVGFLLQSLDFFFLKAMARHKTVILSTLYCFVINEMSGYAIASISPLLFDMTMLVAIVLFLLYSKIVESDKSGIIAK